ncbi:MAG: SCO family protein [Deltaproteobacteria bacterium]
MTKIISGISLLALMLSFWGCSSSIGEEDVFINQLGKEVRLDDFKGKVVLMNFVYTSCPNRGCEQMALQFLRLQLLMKDVFGKDLYLLSVSIDPDKDSQAVLKEYARKMKADSRGWLFLTAKPSVAERIGKKHGVEWKTDPDGTRRHKVVVKLIDRKGDVKAIYEDLDTPVEKMMKDITKLL